MPNKDDATLVWEESQPGYGHGFTEFIPGTKHKLLSYGGTALKPRLNRKFKDEDRYFLNHLHDLYGSKPFQRGDLDAGRLSRLLGQEIVYADADADPSSPETWLKIRLPGPPVRHYRYGTKRTWEIVLDAVLALEKPVSPAEVRAYLAVNQPEFAPKNIAPDLCVLAVNCPSRGHHAPNRRARTTDLGNPYDRLFQIGRGRGVRFTLYDPAVHGVWELVNEGRDVLVPRLLHTADVAELETERQSAEQAGLFDGDTRTRTMAAIVQREGQPAFRQSLLRAYGNACAISGCTIEQLLEAAHIVPYAGQHTNAVTNGLLLRADLHTLFDLHLCCIDPETRRLRLSGLLRGSEYEAFRDVPLRAPMVPAEKPADAALAHHFERCPWANSGALDEE